MVKYETAIVIINYNNNHDTIDCIKSIETSENIPVPFIIVIDNDSREKNIHNQLEFYSAMKVKYLEENIGFGKANNLGIDWLLNNINCDYILILNNDTLIGSDAIHKLTTILGKADKDVIMATPKILVNDLRSEIWYGGGTINYLMMTPKITSHPNEHFTDFASGCAMFFRSNSLKLLNGFDPFFFMYDEDVELSIRIKKNGDKIIYCPESIIYHKCQGSQVKSDSLPSNQLDPNHPNLLFYLGNTIPNRNYIISKHLYGVRKLLSFFANFVYWILKSIQYLLHGKFKAFIFVIVALFTFNSKNK